MDLNPLNQIDPVVIVATIAIVSVTYVLLRRYFVEPYLEVMEKREQLFARADADRQDAASLLDEACIHAEQTVALATERAAKTLSDARERAESYRKERIETASARAAAHLEEGRARVAAMREEEQGRLRRQAIDCVGLACRSLLGPMDEPTVEETVDRLLVRRLT